MTNKFDLRDKEKQGENENSENKDPQKDDPNKMVGMSR